MGMKIRTPLIILFIIAVNAYLILLAMGIEFFSWIYPRLEELSRIIGLKDPLTFILVISLVLITTLGILLASMGKEI